MQKIKNASIHLSRLFFFVKNLRPSLKLFSFFNSKLLPAANCCSSALPFVKWYYYQPIFSVFDKSSMQEPKSSPAQGSIFAMTPKLNADVKVTSTGMSQELVKSNCLPFSICTYRWPFPLGLYRRPQKRDTGSHVYSPVAGWRACRVHRPRLLNRLTPLMVFALVVVERRIH